MTTCNVLKHKQKMPYNYIKKFLVPISRSFSNQIADVRTKESSNGWKLFQINSNNNEKHNDPWEKSILSSFPQRISESS